MKRLQLIIEKGEDGALWGRVHYDDNLLVDSAATLAELRSNMKTLLADFHELEEVEFDLAYDLTAFFEQYDFLKMSKIAEYAGMNPSLLRHYKLGTKHPSPEQVKRIEDAVHELARNLAQLHLVAA